MTEQTWKYHTPERDGHAPDDWVEGLETQFSNRLSCGHDGFWTTGVGNVPWWQGLPYRYRPLQDATYEPDLLAQCLALPQDQREALIEAMQKPQRDWADDLAQQLWDMYVGCKSGEDVAAVIRSLCRPKEELQHVAYYNDGEFYWMSGIAPRDCELFAKRKGRA